MLLFPFTAKYSDYSILCCYSGTCSQPRGVRTGRASACCCCCCCCYYYYYSCRDCLHLLCGSHQYSEYCNHPFLTSYHPTCFSYAGAGIDVLRCCCCFVYWDCLQYFLGAPARKAFSGHLHHCCCIFLWLDSQQPLQTGTYLLVPCGVSLVFLELLRCSLRGFRALVSVLTYGCYCSYYCYLWHLRSGSCYSYFV